MLADMAREHEHAFNPFARARSAAACAELAALPWPAEAQARFAAMAEASLREQAALEAGDTMDFETYRQDYISAARLTPALA
jgi:glutamate--cysteine ligase